MSSRSLVAIRSPALAIATTVASTASPLPALSQALILKHMPNQTIDLDRTFQALAVKSRRTKAGAAPGPPDCGVQSLPGSAACGDGVGPSACGS